jgi:hypothetical protein
MALFSYQGFLVELLTDEQHLQEFMSMSNNGDDIGPSEEKDAWFLKGISEGWLTTIPPYNRQE